MESFLTEISQHRTFSASDLELIERAYRLADQLHAGQKRKSGERYLVHCVAAAKTVALWGLDATTIAAALLHDVLEDCPISAAQLSEKLGPEVAFIVSGATKIGHLKYRGDLGKVETYKKMILAISEDIRVVFVKLADRLHNMQTLRFLPEEKQKRIALETTEIYAPLAYRMGLSSFSGDLEDLAFPYLHPEEYQFLTRELKDHFANGQRYVTKVKELLESSLQEHPKILVKQIDYRSKRLSSLFKKMGRTGMDVSAVYDLLALRVIVSSVEECYAVMGIVHALWPPMAGMIIDYVALPKPNGYRSLHTTVICIDGRPTEFQIRTEEMHIQAEYGTAAYWAYSEFKGSKKYQTGSRYQRSKVAEAKELGWINQLKQWQDQFEEGGEEYLQSLKIDFFKDRIFVITPKGEAIDLPAGSKPVDFAYAIHDQIGEHCVGAKVNGKLVPINTELKSGDLVEILVNKNKKPIDSWLEFVKTSKARTHIRAALRAQGVLPTLKHYEYTVTVEDRLGMLSDLSRQFARNQVSIQGMESPRQPKGLIRVIKFVTGEDGKEKSARMLLKLKQTSGVKDVRFQELQK